MTEKNANGQDVIHTVNKLIELDIGGIVGAVISFLITASVVFFIIIRPMNKLVEISKRNKPIEDLNPVSEDIKLLTEIRDLLKK